MRNTLKYHSMNMREDNCMRNYPQGCRHPSKRNYLHKKREINR